jgi:hypothetical protein
VCFCRKSTDLSWEEDEPSSAVAVPEPSATEAPLPEASVVEGEYSPEAVELLEE